MQRNNVSPRPISRFTLDEDLQNRLKHVPSCQITPTLNLLAGLPTQPDPDITASFRWDALLAPPEELLTKFPWEPDPAATPEACGGPAECVSPPQGEWRLAMPRAPWLAAAINRYHTRTLGFPEVITVFELPLFAGPAGGMTGRILLVDRGPQGAGAGTSKLAWMHQGGGGYVLPNLASRSRRPDVPVTWFGNPIDAFWFDYVHNAGITPDDRRDDMLFAGWCGPTVPGYHGRLFGGERDLTAVHFPDRGETAGAAEEFLSEAAGAAPSRADLSSLGVREPRAARAAFSPPAADHIDDGDVKEYVLAA